MTRLATRNGRGGDWERPWVIDSHRGAFEGGLLENSVPAFLEAVREGANVVETDVRRAGDGQLVLVHNRTIDHVAKFATSVPDEEEFGERPAGLLRAHTAEFLRALEFPRGARVLTFPEFLDFLNKYRVGAQVELKETGFENLLATQFAEAELDYSDLAGPVVVTSFNPLAVWRFRKAALRLEDGGKLPTFKQRGPVPGRETPGVAWGLQAVRVSPGPWGKLVLRLCRKYGAWGFMTHHKYLPVESLPLAHAWGVRFCPRVPSDPVLVDRYVAAGVDGFETDDVPFVRERIEAAGYELPPPPRV
ncbi:MAG: hypothetical protein Kow0069_20150 [Promethearchaeota archaeon]